MDDMKKIFAALSPLGLPLIRGQAKSFPPPYICLRLERHGNESLLRLRLVKDRQSFFDSCDDIKERLFLIAYLIKKEWELEPFGELFQKEMLFRLSHEEMLIINGIRLYPREFIKISHGTELRTDVDGKTLEKPSFSPNEYTLRLDFSKEAERLFYGSTEDFNISCRLGELRLKLRERRLKAGGLEIRLTEKN